jgi:hypothetical protein
MSLGNNGDNGEAQSTYHIDMDWYQEQGRSFALLATSRLSPSSPMKIPKSKTALLNTIRQQSSKKEGFITPDLPLMEMIFRLFLTSGNQPLALEEIRERLEQCLSETGAHRDLSIPKLKRIIEHDRYYGLRPVAQTEGEEP